MALRSAFEDLIGTTLAAVSGIVGKLGYVSSLRGRGNSYSHWGLARVYGEAAAHEALTEAHRLLFTKLLRTPLRTLRNDVAISGEALQMPAREYVENLRSNLPTLLPQDLGGGSAQHFSSVLHALSCLASNQPKIPLAAIPPV
jgi:hypothetical protein